MKHLYSYRELGARIEQGEQVVFTIPVTAKVTTVKQPESDVIHITVTLSKGTTFLGTFESEYTSILTLLDAFDIDDFADIWEVLS